jgi:hypothetical protein
MMCDCEAVGFVPKPLQQVQTLASSRQDHRLVHVRQPDFFQAFGKAAQRYVIDAELVESVGGGGHLGRSAVNNN